MLVQAAQSSLSRYAGEGRGGGAPNQPKPPPHPSPLPAQVNSSFMQTT